MKKLSVLLLVLLFAAACGNGGKRAKTDNPRVLRSSEVKIDQIMQKAKFKNMDGEDVSIADFKGKVVLFDFWETWCGPCRQVFPSMDSLRAEYPNDFEVVAVNLQNSDTPEDVQAFIDENGYDFNWVLDDYGIGMEVITYGIPFKVFVDPDGFLIKSETGSRGSEEDYTETKRIIEKNKKS